MNFEDLIFEEKLFGSLIQARVDITENMSISIINSPIMGMICKESYECAVVENNYVRTHTVTPDLNEEGVLEYIERAKLIYSVISN